MSQKPFLSRSSAKNKYAYIPDNYSDLQQYGPGRGCGLIRDHLGNRIKGFARCIGHACSIIAELWALRDGLQLAKLLNFSFVSIEVDAAEVVSMAIKGVVEWHPISSSTPYCA